MNRVVSSLHGTLIGKKVALLGYAFKNNTSDTRESPAIDVFKLLLADRPSEIAIFDPQCNPTDIKNEVKRLFPTTGLNLLKPDGPIEVYHNAYDACFDASATLIFLDRMATIPLPSILSTRICFSQAQHEQHRTPGPQEDPLGT